MLIIGRTYSQCRTNGSHGKHTNMSHGSVMDVMGPRLLLGGPSQGSITPSHLQAIWKGSPTTPPHLKKYARQIGLSPQVRVKIENWNHHLSNHSYYLLFEMILQVVGSPDFWKLQQNGRKLHKGLKSDVKTAPQTNPVCPYGGIVTHKTRVMTVK